MRPSYSRILVPSAWPDKPMSHLKNVKEVLSNLSRSVNIANNNNKLLLIGDVPTFICTNCVKSGILDSLHHVLASAISDASDYFILDSG